MPNQVVGTRAGPGRSSAGARVAIIDGAAARERPGVSGSRGRCAGLEGLHGKGARGRESGTGRKGCKAGAGLTGTEGGSPGTATGNGGRWERHRDLVRGPPLHRANQYLSFRCMSCFNCQVPDRPAYLISFVPKHNATTNSRKDTPAGLVSM